MGLAREQERRVLGREIESLDGVVLAQAAKQAGIRGEVTDIGWGNQIRSYVMQPYTMVKDLRTGEETGNVDAVMDGALDPFMNAYLKWMSLGCPKRNTSDAD